MNQYGYTITSQVTDRRKAVTSVIVFAETHLYHVDNDNLMKDAADYVKNVTEQGLRAQIFNRELFNKKIAELLFEALKNLPIHGDDSAIRAKADELRNIAIPELTFIRSDINEPVNKLEFQHTILLDASLDPHEPIPMAKIEIQTRAERT